MGILLFFVARCAIDYPAMHWARLARIRESFRLALVNNGLERLALFISSVAVAAQICLGYLIGLILFDEPFGIITEWSAAACLFAVPLSLFLHIFRKPSAFPHMTDDEFQAAMFKEG